MGAAGQERRRRAAAVAGLAALALLPGLGGARRLTYHEALWAQSARELLARGDWMVPTLDGRPWLEKPPLGTWLIAAAGWAAGGVGEASARLPSALAAMSLALAVAALTSRRLGPSLGVLAGCVQATASWAVLRGRLAEADILLAALIAWALVAVDRLRDPATPRVSMWRAAFFTLMGATALVKGVGFGAALVGSAVSLTLLWDRDRATARSLLWPTGWAVAALIGLAWPLAVLARHPEALGWWSSHIADRLAGRPAQQIDGEPWWQYAPSPLVQMLPWTPLALAGACISWHRARREPRGLDRLLWAWAIGPAVLVSLAKVRNGHYLIHALPPWSVWSALALARLGDRLRGRGWLPGRLRRGAVAAFVGLGLAYAAGFVGLGPATDRRGAEWSWYAEAARRLGPDEPLVLVYNYPEWDRLPYSTPFGPLPHDLAVRLFYLDRPARWQNGPPSAAAPFAAIARDADLPALRRLGPVEVLARSPRARPDRAFALVRVGPAIRQVSRR